MTRTGITKKSRRNSSISRLLATVTIKFSLLQSHPATENPNNAPSIFQLGISEETLIKKSSLDRTVQNLLRVLVERLETKLILSNSKPYFQASASRKTKKPKAAGLLINEEDTSLPVWEVQ